MDYVKFYIGTDCTGIVCNFVTDRGRTNWNLYSGPYNSRYRFTDIFIKKYKDKFKSVSNKTGGRRGRLYQFNAASGKWEETTKKQILSLLVAFIRKEMDDMILNLICVLDRSVDGEHKKYITKYITYLTREKWNLPGSTKLWNIIKKHIMRNSIGRI